MINIYSLEHTLTLLSAVERVDAPFNFLSETFFPQKETLETDFAVVEFKRVGRHLAPYIVEGSRGVNIARDNAEAKYYRVPLMAARRTISLGDLKLRQFGEVPSLYNPVRPEERAAKMQAQDLVELLRLHSNRRGQMAAEILQTGKLALKQYADDGQVSADAEIDFGWTGEITPLVTWDNANATIYSDLKAVSERIQVNSGVIPTVAICGRNVEQYLMRNEEIRNWLMVPNRGNLAMASIEPRFISPEVRYIGRISALNMELVSYAQTYIDLDGTKKEFIEPDNAIIGVEKMGKTVNAPVTIFVDGEWRTIVSEYVPKYSYNNDAETTSLTVYSRCLQVPDTLADWCVIKTRG